MLHTKWLADGVARHTLMLAQRSKQPGHIFAVSGVLTLGCWLPDRSVLVFAASSCADSPVKCRWPCRTLSVPETTCLGVISSHATVRRTYACHTTDEVRPCRRLCNVSRDKGMQKVTFPRFHSLLAIPHEAVHGLSAVKALQVQQAHCYQAASTPRLSTFVKLLLLDKTVDNCRGCTVQCQHVCARHHLVGMACQHKHKY